MRFPFPRRRILDPLTDDSGAVVEWLIPRDTGAKDNEDALVRHFRRLARFDPVTLVRLMSSPLSSLVLGRVRIKGDPIGIDSLENFDEIERATPGSLSAEEYERQMLGQSPLQMRVCRRLRAE